MRHRALAAEVRHRDDRAAAALAHQRLGAACHRDERVARHVEREEVVLALRVGEAALEIVRLGERDRVHQQVEPAEPLRHLREGAIEALVVPDVALDAELAAEARGQLAHVRLDARTLVGEGERRTLGCESLRHGPRDRPSIRHAGDERQLPVEESRHGDATLPDHNRTSATCA